MKYSSDIICPVRSYCALTLLVLASLSTQAAASADVPQRSAPMILKQWITLGARLSVDAPQVDGPAAVAALSAAVVLPADSTSEANTPLVARLFAGGERFVQATRGP